MNNDFTDRLTLLLEAKDLKVADLVKITGLSKQAVYDIANGKVENYNKKFIKNLTEYTGVNLSWLLTGKGEMFLDVNKEVYINTIGRNNSGVQQNGKQVGSNSTVEEKDKEIAYLKGQLEGLQSVVDKLLKNK